MVSRRNFFERVILGIAGLIGLALAIPLAGFAILPTLKKRAEPWSEIGPLNLLDVDRPKEFEVVRSVTSGWMKSNSVRSVWGFRRPDGEVVIYSPICPHLGCEFQWFGEDDRFVCPCHNSVFDLSGRVLDGPAPRPLDTLPTKVEQDRLFVRYREFKVGTPRKEEV
jgi:menaquinol-cytochrome c reductase iron-sulfur subunit